MRSWPLARHSTQRSRGSRWSPQKKFIASLLAMVCVLLSVSVAPAWAAGDTDGGPGVWGPAKSGGAKPTSQAYEYEGQINGRGAQFNYWVPYPETRQQPGFNIQTWEPWTERPGQPGSGAAFDGWDRTQRRLLDAKGPGYADLLDPKNLKWFDVGFKETQQAERQVKAAAGTPIRWHWAEHEAQRRMIGMLPVEVEQTVTKYGQPTAFTAPGSPADPDGMAKPKGPAVRPAPGGVDFSTLQLRHVSAGSLGPNGIGYSFKTPSSELSESDFNAVEDSSNAFFVWLRLQPSQFWVNLNPSQPDRIMDPDLARTDVGRVMLEADLQLKTTFAPLTGPGTPTGDEYVRRIIQGGPDNEVCTSYRYWIEPAPATVRDTGSELYILDAPLNVMAETLYFVDPNTGPTCPGQTPERARYNESVIRSLVLPEVVRAVNQDPEYADLRRVYMSRVAAEWYRQVSATQDTLYKALINDGIVGPYTWAQPWDPMDVFNEYLRQYNNPNQGSIEVGGITYNWAFGGVDMSEAPADPMSAAQFTEQYPRLPAVVQESIEQPAKDPDSQTIWAGGTTVIEPEPPAAAPQQPSGLAATGTSKWLWVTGLLFCVGGVLLLVLARRRRRRPVS